MGALSPDSSKQCESLRLLGSREATHPLGRCSQWEESAASLHGQWAQPRSHPQQMVGLECWSLGQNVQKPWQGSQTAPKAGGGGDGSLLSNSDAFPEM